MRLISKTEQLLLLQWIIVHWLISWIQHHIHLAVLILDMFPFGILSMEQHVQISSIISADMLMVSFTFKSEVDN